jgi:hypothetical protein
MLAGIPLDVAEEFRPQIEAALRSLPISSLSLTPRNKLLFVNVEYDADDNELDENLLERVIDLVQGVIPEDRLEQSPSFADPELGAFAWDAHWWGGECEIAGLDEPLSLHLSTEREVLPSPTLLAHAREIVRDILANDERWKSFAVDALSENFNRNWNQGEPLTREQFRANLEISSITLEESGWTHAYYFAGEMFGDHEVEISISPKGELQSGLLGG